MGKKANAINKVAKAIDASADASSNSVKGALKSLIVACDSTATPTGDSVPGLIEQVADVVPSGGGGGGSEYAISYNVLGPGGGTIEPDSEYGSVKAMLGAYDPDEEFIYVSSSTPLDKAAAGSWIIVQMTPSSGYGRQDLTPRAFIDECGMYTNVLPTQGDAGWYFFIMPDKDVTVRAQFNRAIG